MVQPSYPAIRHIKDGDLIREWDCVLIKSGPRKRDIPYVAKIGALYECPETGLFKRQDMKYVNIVSCDILL